MAAKNTLQEITGLEKELREVRRNITKTEGELMHLEKQLFSVENQLEHELLWQFSHLKAMEGKSEREAKKIRKAFTHQMIKFSLSSRSEQVSRTLLQQKTLEQKLDKLRAEMHEELQKAGKK